MECGGFRHLGNPGVGAIKTAEASLAQRKRSKLSHSIQISLRCFFFKSLCVMSELQPRPHKKRLFFRGL